MGADDDCREVGMQHPRASTRIKSKPHRTAVIVIININSNSAVLSTLGLLQRSYATLQQFPYRGSCYLGYEQGDI